MDGAARKSIELSILISMLASGSMMVGSLVRRTRALARRRESDIRRRLCRAMSRSSMLNASKTELGRMSGPRGDDILRREEASPPAYA